MRIVTTAQTVKPGYTIYYKNSHPEKALWIVPNPVYHALATLDGKQQQHTRYMLPSAPITVSRAR